MKKPVPRKLKLPPAPISEPPPPVPPPPTRSVPPRPKLPSAAVPNTPFVFTPIAPPNRADPYRPPQPLETFAGSVPPPPTPPREPPPQAMPRPAPRPLPQASYEARSTARDLMIAAIGALVMFFCAIIPAAMGIDAFGIGQMLGIAGREQVAQPVTPPQQQVRPEVSKRDFDLLALRLNQATERISSLEHSVEVLAARSAQQEPGPGQSDEVIAPLAGAPQSGQQEQAQTPATSEAVSTPDADGLKADKWTYTLKPGQGVQLKLAMEKGAAVRYAWTVRGGLVNYDMQGSGEGTTTTYKSRRDATSDNGVLTAAVSGDHGWFWRNSGAQDVIITLATRGTYASLRSTP